MPTTSLTSNAIQKQSAASGNSPMTASASAHVSSRPGCAVTRSNQASQRRAVPATAANIATSGDRRRIAISVATSAVASKRSKPAQARSQWCVTWLEGSVALR
jgi:hypothetical protein